MDERDRRGISVLYQPRQSESTDSDLVAIHGLNGHPFLSWTHKQTGVMWLKDMLPDELPNTRIMTYGYDAKFRHFTGHQDLTDNAEGFLDEVGKHRQSPKEASRPIFLVCHCLGGVVAKKALLLAPKIQEHAKIQKAVVGVVFLATPHTTQDPITTAKILARIAAAHSPLQALKSSKSKSRVLYEITSDFQRDRPDISFVSFYETKQVSIGPFKRLLVEQGSAVLGFKGEDQIGQQANHLDIATFSGKKDLNFPTVRESLKKLYKNVTTRSLSVSSKLPGSQASGSGLGSDIRLSKTNSEASSYFEIPFLPCEYFKGREDLIERMQDYFGFVDESMQKRYVLAGLGGCGKTHAALHYAKRNRTKYRHGVFFFNASSKETLTASIGRYLDLIQLSGASNKTDAFKKWLSRPENSDWLLIFDNADDLATTPISTYIPTTTHGHILVTTRDQAAIGRLSDHGTSMDVLDEDSAIDVLLSKANLKSVNADDVEQCKLIVKQLGYLPLAVEQAGAFVRLQQKPLREYRLLCEERVYEGLHKEGQTENDLSTYVPVWDLNFRQIEIDMPMAANFLLMLSYLESMDISEAMLRRGVSSKRIWNGNGEVAELSAKEAGVRSDIIDLIQSPTQFNRAIEKLLAFSLIKPYNAGKRGRVFSIHPLVQHCATQRAPAIKRQRWAKQAILIVCQAFPYNTYVEESFGDKGRDIFAHIPRILQEYDTLASNGRFTLANKRYVSIMLLSSVKFSSTEWKMEAVARAKELVLNDKDVYLRAWLATAESTVLRSQGKLGLSVSALEDHIHNTTLPGLDANMESDARWNAQRGELITSFAETLFREDDLQRAKEELEAWHPLQPYAPTSMEKLVMNSRDMLLGRIYKDMGLFADALPLFRGLLRETGLVSNRSTGWQLEMLNHLSDTYCELGQPLEAEVVIKQQLKLVYENGWEELATGRRLRLSLIETQIRRGDFEMAKTGLDSLLPSFETIQNPNEVQRTFHIRTWAGFARIAHLEKRWTAASDCWSHALGVIEAAGWVGGFLQALLQYSLAQALYQAGQRDAASDLVETAEKIFKIHRRRYWMVGLGSYWFDYIHVPLGTEGPNCVVLQPRLEVDLDLLLDPAGTHATQGDSRRPAPPMLKTPIKSEPLPKTAPGLSKEPHERSKSIPRRAKSTERLDQSQPLSKSSSREPIRPHRDAPSMLGIKVANDAESRRWFRYLDDALNFFDEEGVPDWEGTDEPVKIAVLDTGANMNHPYLRSQMDRIEVEGFTDDGDPCDLDGHGTNVVALILRVARNASVYVAKVFQSPDPFDPRAVVDAIDHAIKEWNVDIINMSFGFDESHPEIRQAIQRAHAADILMFAAGHNDGANKPLAFPASAQNVIAIGATTSEGKDASFSPLIDRKSMFFTTFGEHVVTLGTEQSGTSFATPIAVGIAACIMDYANHLMDPAFFPALGRTEEERKTELEERRRVMARIKTLEGMNAILRECARGPANYLAPWTLFKPGERGVRHIFLHRLKNASRSS